MSTYEDLGDRAEQMVPVAARLVGAVHDDGPATVARIIATVTPENTPALLVVLAAMVDAEQSPGTLLAWVDASLNDRYNSPTLFTTGSESNDPRAWPDHICHQLAKEYRRDPDGEPRDETRLLAAYREWDRRRHRRPSRMSGTLSETQTPLPHGDPSSPGGGATEPEPT